MSGPLTGIRIVMMGGLGPGPFCGMLLGGLGADVVRVDRVTDVDQPPPIDTVLRRSQRSIAVDMKHPDGRELVYALTAGADAFVDVYRPGAAERLGIGPDDLLDRRAVVAVPSRRSHAGDPGRARTRRQRGVTGRCRPPERDSLRRSGISRSPRGDRATPSSCSSMAFSVASRPPRAPHRSRGVRRPHTAGERRPSAAGRPAAMASLIAPVTVPTGCSVFPHEIRRPSRRWAEQRFTNIHWWSEPAKGGHFAAFEQPALFVDEVRSSFRPLR